MAGYKPRDGFDKVRDSLYARIMRVDNGSVSALLINVDLLLFPPKLKDRLIEKLKGQNQDHHFLFLAATHTHNGVGGWDDSPVGQLILGSYDDQWVEEIAARLAEAVTRLNPQPAKISPWEIDASEWVENRIAFDKGKKDGMLRGFTVERKDNKKALFFTYSAHATSIPKEIRHLSADYPADVIKLAEREFDFGMYMAGMVGSHRFVWFPDQYDEYVPKVSGLLYQRISERKEEAYTDQLSITSAHIPIPFGPSQMRISKDWKVRDWVFRWMINPLEGELTVLALGDILLIGTPCDFSGEIYVEEALGALAASKGKHLLITSFNGNYNGYITYDGHYDSVEKDEVRTMNWVGPHYGSYFARMIRALFERM
jgi:hypothetical protein